jgi:hypothetical protein
MDLSLRKYPWECGYPCGDSRSQLSSSTHVGTAALGCPVERSSTVSPLLFMNFRFSQNT